MELKEIRPGIKCARHSPPGRGTAVEQQWCRRGRPDRRMASSARSWRGAAAAFRRHNDHHADQLTDLFKAMPGTGVCCNEILALQ